MVTDQLIAFIKEQQSAGKTKSQITDLLAQNGWNPQDISAGFEQVKTGVPVPSSQTTRPAGQFLGVFELLTQSWNLFTKRWQTFFGIIAFQILAGIAIFILMMASGLTSLFLSSSGIDKEAINLGGSILLFVICLVAILAISLFSFLGYIATYHVVRSGPDVGVKQAYGYAWSKFGSFLWVYILTMMVMAGGMMLLFVPGLIASVALSFSLLVLLTEDIKGYDALVRSWQYVYGHWWSILWRFFAFEFWLVLAGGILGAITMGIASSLIGIVATPIMAAYTYLLFNNLKSLPRDPQALTRPNSHFKVFAILGIIAIIGYISLTVIIIAGVARSSIN